MARRPGRVGYHGPDLKQCGLTRESHSAIIKMWLDYVFAYRAQLNKGYERRGPRRRHDKSRLKKRLRGNQMFSVRTLQPLLFSSRGCCNSNTCPKGSRSTPCPDTIPGRGVPAEPQSACLNKSRFRQTRLMRVPPRHKSQGEAFSSFLLGLISPYGDYHNPISRSCQ